VKSRESRILKGESPLGLEEFSTCYKNRVGREVCVTVHSEKGSTDSREERGSISGKR